MDLIKEIVNGENKILEFKRQLPSNSDISKTIISFSNTSGGKLIIGIDDNREIIGISEDIFDLQDKITSIISDSCTPDIRPEIYTLNIAGKIVLVIEIVKGNNTPYYIKSQGKEQGTYIRIGATNRRADLESIKELERQARNISFDEEPNYEYELSSLDISPLLKEAEKTGKILNNEKMKNLKLIKEENGKEYATNGLLILLGLLENSKIMCARFRGTTMSVFLDKKEYSDNVFSQLENAIIFIENHINIRSEIKWLQRVDYHEIPITAIRETLINAIVHRDYSRLGRNIKVAVYDDILNVVSPGGFPNNITELDVISGRSEVRNRVIARVFKEFNYIEQWGSGINRIITDCKQEGLKEPKIKEKNDFIDVEIYRASIVSDPIIVKDEPTETIGNHRIPSDTIGTQNALSDQELEIIESIAKKNKITTKEVEETLGIKEARAREILKKMREKKYIEKKGTGRNTYYTKPTH